MPSKWRLDSPVSEIRAAFAALTTDQLRDSIVEFHSAAGEAWVEVYSPRDNPVPVISVELPADPVRAGIRCEMVLGLLRQMSDVCDQTVRYAA